MADNLNRGVAIDYQPGLQEGLIGNRGADMVHEIGIACPKCRTSDVHANMLGDGKLQTRSPNCPNCGADGWLFRDPLVVRGLAVGIRQQKTVLDAGLAQPGDMTFSPPADAFATCGQDSRRIGRNDKLTATWSQPLDDGQTIVRGAANMQDNVGLANNVNITEDRLWYEPDKALWCEDENGVRYDSGDFELGPGKVIHWIGNAPIQGVKYTLKYTAFFEWIAWMPPQERVDRNRDLGPLVLLRKRHVAFINSSPFISDSDRTPLSARVEC